MNNHIVELKNKITNNLSEILELKHTVRKKDLEHHDLMKDFFLSVIDVIDSFENKKNSLKEKYSDKPEMMKIVNNFDSIKKKLINLLAKYDITKIEFPENKLIIGLSKVIATEPDSTRQNDTIIMIIRDGYIRGKEVIREAELIVVKN